MLNYIQAGNDIAVWQTSTRTVYLSLKYNGYKKMSTQYKQWRQPCATWNTYYNLKVCKLMQTEHTVVQNARFAQSKFQNK